ncbi:MAG TPA: serine/threonine-protein kinase, partial [Vicinamibacteria bacterium]|nr:serine/threonine-protein kinase [Vicinamibacteria bacterium]
MREFLGKGGMGFVFKARDRMLEEDVAVKALRSDTPLDVARRFRTEIKLARRVRHPNVCAIHEYGEERELRYIVMELIKGVDLREVLRTRGRLPPAEATQVVSQIAQGLEAIHRLGIIHRDLKTSNVMRDVRGVIHVMDFGIAKSLDSEGATATGVIVGTPEYMSPEQAKSHKVDHRSDIYALGVVTY